MTTIRAAFLAVFLASCATTSTPTEAVAVLHAENAGFDRVTLFAVVGEQRFRLQDLEHGTARIRILPRHVDHRTGRVQIVAVQRPLGAEWVSEALPLTSAMRITLHRHLALSTFTPR